jgi:hypothetical protein
MSSVISLTCPSGHKSGARIAQICRLTDDPCAAQLIIKMAAVTCAVPRGTHGADAGLGLNGRNSQDLWIGVSRDLLITTL